jgi:hypothetical protein
MLSVDDFAYDNKEVDDYESWRIFSWKEMGKWQPVARMASRKSGSHFMKVRLARSGARSTPSLGLLRRFVGAARRALSPTYPLECCNFF